MTIFEDITQTNEYDFPEKKVLDEIDNLCFELWESPAEIVYGEEFYNLKISQYNEILEKLRKEVEQTKQVEEKTKGKYKLKELWRKAWNSVIFDQPEICEFYFYAFIGQVFFHDFRIFLFGRSDDLRIFPVIIGGSGTGKTEANNFMELVIQKVIKQTYIDEETGIDKTEYFKCELPSKFTDAALVGGLDGELYKQQKTKRIHEDDERYVPPVQFGALQKGDMVIFDEAERVFEPGKFGQEVQVILRNAMNRYGSGGNRLSNDSLQSKGKVKFYCSASIIMTSYPIDKFDEVFKKGGLLQRCSILILPPDPDKQDNIIKTTNKGYASNPDDLKKQQIAYTEDIQKLVEVVNKMKESVYNYKYQGEWKFDRENDSRRPMLHSEKTKKKYDHYYEKIKNIIPMQNLKDKENYNNILSRINNRLHKASVLNNIVDTLYNALMDARMNVEKVILPEYFKVTAIDVDEAYKTLIKMEALSSAEHIIMSGKEADFDTQKMVQHLRVILSKPLLKTELNDKMKERLKLGTNRVISILKQLKNAGYYNETQDGSTIICELDKKIKMF